MDSTQSTSQIVNVGDRLRELRVERDLSMRSLARISGLSTNALSMIERSRTSPSVSTLYKIATALKVPITAFFRSDLSRQDIVFRKAEERTRVAFPRGEWEGLGGEFFMGGVEPLLFKMEIGANSGQFSMQHSGHEFVLCLTGILEYEVEKQRYMLEPGDSLLFAAHLDHRWRNANKGDTQVLIVLSGFDRGEQPSEYHITQGSKEDSIT